MFSPWIGKIPWGRAWQPTPVFLPGESPWTEKPGGLQSMGSQRVGHDWAARHMQHTNLMYLTAPFWKSYVQLQRFPLYFCHYSLLSKDKMWQESNALITPYKLITNFQLAAATAEEYRMLKQILFCSWTGSLGVIAKCPNQKLLWKHDKTHRCVRPIQISKNGEL